MARSTMARGINAHGSRSIRFRTESFWAIRKYPDAIFVLDNLIAHKLLTKHSAALYQRPAPTRTGERSDWILTILSHIITKNGEIIRTMLDPVELYLLSERVIIK